MNIKSTYYHAETGTKETTKKSHFFDVTNVINCEGIPKGYKKIFLGKFQMLSKFSNAWKKMRERTAR